MRGNSFSLLVHDDTPALLAYIQLAKMLNENNEKAKQIKTSTVILEALRTYYEEDFVPIFAGVCKGRCENMLFADTGRISIRAKKYEGTSFCAWLETEPSEILRQILQMGIQIVDTPEEEFCLTFAEMRHDALKRGNDMGRQGAYGSNGNRTNVPRGTSGGVVDVEWRPVQDEDEPQHEEAKEPDYTEDIRQTAGETNTRKSTKSEEEETPSWAEWSALA